MNILFKYFFILIPLILVLSCGEEEVSTFTQTNSAVPLQITINTPENTNQTSLQTANLEDFLEFVTTVSVIVQGDFPTISQLFSIGEPVIIFVPPGQNRTFIVSLLNAQGQAVCSGQTTTDILPGVANEISIDCEVVDEVCDDGSDNNGNDLIDCAEDACAGSQCDDTNINICIDNECGEPSPPISDPEDICNDGIDNDEDGDIDCNDLDCAFDSICQEICDDLIDNDQDGNADCEDIDCNNRLCGTDMICQNLQCVNIGENNCADNIDNDDDGLIDCMDPDCNNRTCDLPGSACIGGECAEIECSDNINNDNDNLFGQFEAIDCDDEDCEGQSCGVGFGASCRFFGEGGECEETNCSDMIDNDEDSSIDCDDFFDCDDEICDPGFISSTEFRCFMGDCCPNGFCGQGF